MHCTKCRKAFVRIVVNPSQWNGDSESIRKWEQILKEKNVLLHADCHRELHYSKNVDELVLLTQGL